MAQVPHQPAQEPGTVLALEGQLLIVDDDGVHRLRYRAAAARRRMAARGRALDSSGQGGADPVSGQKEARHAGLVGRARRRVRSHREGGSPFPHHETMSQRGLARLRHHLAKDRERRPDQGFVGLFRHPVRGAGHERQLVGRAPGRADVEHPLPWPSRQADKRHVEDLPIEPHVRGDNRGRRGGGRGLPDRPKARVGLRAQPIEGVPLDGGNHCPGSHAFLIDAHGHDIAVESQPSLGLRSDQPAMLFEERTRRPGEELVERRLWQHQRRPVTAFQHAVDHFGEGRRRRHVYRLVERGDGQGLPQHFDQPRRLPEPRQPAVHGFRRKRRPARRQAESREPVAQAQRRPSPQPGEQVERRRQRGARKPRPAPGRVHAVHGQAALHRDLGRRADAAKQGERLDVAAHQDVLPVVGAAPRSGDREGRRPATQRRPGLQQNHPCAALGQARRRAQAGNAAADDHHVGFHAGSGRPSIHASATAA